MTTKAVRLECELSWEGMSLTDSGQFPILSSTQNRVARSQEVKCAVCLEKEKIRKENQ